MQRLSGWAVSLAACGLWATTLLAHADEGALDALRHAVAVNPNRGLEELQRLREQAMRDGDLGARWRIDDIACLVYKDMNVAQAVAVADAGLALADATPVEALRPAWWRLRACRAGALLLSGRQAEGEAELAALLATRDLAPPPGTAAWALARMVRGIDRARRGDPVSAHEDLVVACDTLRQNADRRDLELCLCHLANHYRRIDDNAEALRLLEELLASASGRGELYDVSIHAYNLASVQAELELWPASLGSARAAEQASAHLDDRVGLGFAGRAVARALARTGQLPEALARAELALQQLDPQAEGREHEALRLLQAQLLGQAGQHAQALVRLDAMRQAVLDRRERDLLRQWHLARAGALSGMGRWREAYEAQLAADAVAREMHRLRLSEQAARMGKQFLRSRDVQEIAALRELAESERRLRTMQAVALGLFTLLVGGLLLLAVRKVLQVRRLQRLATTDELTGLPNRRAVLRHAADALAVAERQSQPVAFLMLDIDHFKRINDTYGHPVGDAVIRQASHVLLGALRSGDQLGRVGGEEFLAVLSHANEDDARQVAERMRLAILANPLRQGTEPLAFSVSIGIAHWRSGDSVDALVERCDAALYRAKSAGRNTVMT